ncbi:MAG: hypothetical protein SGI77_06300 [Pirellulaceae bacterium]|nr:hypothetical protein [Pirellulaceae bacterium]
MTQESPQEIELTDDLLDYIKRSAIKEARKHCPGGVDFDDVGFWLGNARHRPGRIET